MNVTALLVCHDGARWLPAVLDGLAHQTRPPDRTVVVDTGSTDASTDLVRARAGDARLVELPAGTSFPAAVARGMTATDPDPDPGTGSGPEAAEWLWVLHDDSRPAPYALQRLVEAAEAHPGTSLFGAKVREWPSLRRLLEVGVTISGTGRRETGLERGEYDQGQHDRPREVLAVSSAGLLVRRDVLDALGGFDARLPVFGNDLDLGWRAARAGHRTMVVPDAVVFHAEAAHRGVRSGTLAAAPHRKERAAALYTLLTGVSPVALPFVILRLFLGSLLRAAGLLLVRAPREAFDELLALLSTYLRPDRVVLGRRQRRRTTNVPAREVRHLLAPPWVPYRHGLDLLSDLAAAVAHRASDVSAARRTRSGESGPVPAEAEELASDTGVLARVLGSPVAVGLVLLVVLTLVALRDVLGGGALAGGALLPAPASAADWWRLHLAGVHDARLGTATVAGPYLLPLALAGTLLAGSAALVVELLFLAGVPLAAWGAWRFLRAAVGSRGGGHPVILAWGALTYALGPVLSGALHQGRLGTMVLAVALPWVAGAALHLGAGEPRDRRWRAAWRTAVGLALLAAFVPLTWVVAAVLVLVLPAGAALVGGTPAAWWCPRLWAPVVLPVLAVPVLLAPWVVRRGYRPEEWWVEAGLPAADLVPDLGALQVVVGRAAEVGAAPAWIGVGLAVATLLALVRRTSRPAVLACWAVVAVSTAAVLWVDREGAWAGSMLLLAHGAAVTAVVLAGVGTRNQLAGRSFGWRQPVLLVVVLGAALAPVAGMAWWISQEATGPLERGPVHRLPVYMVEASERDRATGVLVVTGDTDGYAYTLVRGAGMRLGEDTIRADGVATDRLTGLVADLATDPGTATLDELSGLGVEFLYLPPPASPDLAGNLDAVGGLSTASAPRPGARAWQLDAAPGVVPPEPVQLHTLFLGVQGAAIVVAVVLAAPTRRRQR